MKKLLIGLFALVLSVSAFTVPVSATSVVDSFGAETAILTTCGGDADNGAAGVYCILGMAVDIMAALIGVLGVLGIVITGVQYVTAGGSEEKVKKAKKRLVEIIIGLVAYALIYSVLSWLIPDFNTGNPNKDDSSSNSFLETSSLVLAEHSSHTTL